MTFSQSYPRGPIRKGPPPAPFSLRLSADERERLKAEAGTQPLGTYIRERLLDDGAPRRRRSGLMVEDRKALGQALALLGKSRFSSNLNQIAHLGNIGTLDLSEETLADLHEALAHVAEIRRLLVDALGLKSGDAP